MTEVGGQEMTPRPPRVRCFVEFVRRTRPRSKNVSSQRRVINHTTLPNHSLVGIAICFGLPQLCSIKQPFIPKYGCLLSYVLVPRRISMSIESNKELPVHSLLNACTRNARQKYLTLKSPVVIQPIRIHILINGIRGVPPIVSKENGRELVR